MKATSMFGITMIRRSRRRTLVLGVYLFLFFVVVLRLALKHSFVDEGSFLSSFNVLFIALFIVVSRAIFGQLVEQNTFPLPPQEGPRNQGPTSLFHSERSAALDPDERDLIVRNRAYFYAFRVIAIYSALLWIAYSCLNASRMQISSQAAALLLLPLIVMAVTLPQAVLLWTEPDVPSSEDEGFVRNT